MNARTLMLPLLLEFVDRFTAPGFLHFQNSIMAHSALLGLQHCVTEAMRPTGVHHRRRWTTPYVFTTSARWSCRDLSQRLLGLVASKLGTGAEVIAALDDTPVPKSGTHFFGLGYHPDPTGKNPGAHKRRVLGRVLVSRLRTNARLYLLPPKQPPGKRGPKPKKGKQVSAAALGRKKSGRRELQADIYGKAVAVTAFVDVPVSGPALGRRPILAVIFPQRSGMKSNVFFTTDLAMTPERLLEIYGGGFRIEDAFDELKTAGGMGDYRQRSLTAAKRHVTLCLAAYGLLRLLSVTVAGAERIEAEPWWSPPGPPSATRLGRAVRLAFRIVGGSRFQPQPQKIPARKEAA